MLVAAEHANAQVAEPELHPKDAATVRLVVRVHGVVQGVGYRPFVQALAVRHGVSGFVLNRSQSVHLEVQGEDAAVRRFVTALTTEAPRAAKVERVDGAPLPTRAESGFSILPSETAPEPPAHAYWGLPPDLATCDACVREVNSSTQRRFRYPFTSCTQCGPRFSIIECLPFDRGNTSMAPFALCEGCQVEYAATADRRCFAQTVACPECGPHVRLLDAEGEELAVRDVAMRAACAALASGQIVALLGLGGFQLLVDATNQAAVARLRERKRRPHKPLAVMFADLAAAQAACLIGVESEALLTSKEAPIVLVPKRVEVTEVVAPSVAPKTPVVGIVLPTTPLHHLVTRDFGRPVVCTSGNLAGEPLCIEPVEAQARLRGVADVFLVHDRKIVRPIDDSVVRAGPEGLEVVRRARGYAPAIVSFPAGPTVLALGGHQKNTIAIAHRRQAFVSQHLGNLGTPLSRAYLERSVDEALALLDVRVDVIACDLHPDYGSTTVAEELGRRWGVPLIRVQHHHAHVAACVAEHAITGPVLGLAWDGAGLGADGTLWGGEALMVEGYQVERAAHLRHFPLPGGERAAREPRRAAFGLLFASGNLTRVRAGQFWTDIEAQLFRQMCERGTNAPLSSSIGRLVDAVAALLGVGQTPSFEAQAAQALEHLACPDESAAYPFPLVGAKPAVLDWQPLVDALLFDIERGTQARRCAARFHNALTDAAEALAEHAGVPRIVLTGGCFQNQRLRQSVSRRLRTRGFEPYLPRQFPCNDGGLALGQAYVAVLREPAYVSRHSR